MVQKKKRKPGQRKSSGFMPQKNKTKYYREKRLKKKLKMASSTPSLPPQPSQHQQPLLSQAQPGVSSQQQDKSKITDEESIIDSSNKFSLVMELEHSGLYDVSSEVALNTGGQSEKGRSCGISLSTGSSANSGRGEVSVQNSETGAVYIGARKNSQLSSPVKLRPARCFSNNTSSSRENSKKQSNQTIIFEEYSKEWRTPPSDKQKEITSTYVDSRKHNFSNQPQSIASPKIMRRKTEIEEPEIESSSEDEQSDAESDAGGENVNNIISSKKMEHAEEYSPSYQNSQTENNFDNNFEEESSQQANGRPRVLSLTQIVLGKKSITRKCRADIMLGPTPYLMLEFEERQRDQHKTRKLTINFSDIVEGLKYFILNDTAGEGDEDNENPSESDLRFLSTIPESFIVFDVEYDDAHDLNRFRNSYEPFPEQDQEDKRWIILEPRSTSRFLLLIDWLRSNKPINIQKLSVEDASKYIQKINAVQDQHQTVVELEENLQKPENKDQVKNEDVCDNVTPSNVTAIASKAHSEQEVNIDEIIKLFVFVEETHEAFDLTVQMCNTVGYVKHMIMEQKNIPVDQQCLLWKGDEMLGARKLFEYGIKNSSSLFLKKCISL